MTEGRSEGRHCLVAHTKGTAVLVGTRDRAPRCPSAGTLGAEEKGLFSRLRRGVWALPLPVFLRGDPESWRAAPTALRPASGQGGVREGSGMLGPDPSEDMGAGWSLVSGRPGSLPLPLFLRDDSAPPSWESCQWALPCPAVGSDGLCFLWGVFWQPPRQLAR